MATFEKPYSSQVILSAEHPDAKEDHLVDRLKIRGRQNGLESTSVAFGYGEDGRVTNAFAKSDLAEALASLKSPSRLYIAAHGSWRSQTVGKLRGTAWAKGLHDAGIGDVDLISIVSCNAGYDNGANHHRIVVSMDSFASLFHRTLRELTKRKHIVYARPYYVLSGAADGVPFKRTALKGDSVGVHHRERSKLRLSWKGDIQEREWVNYNKGALNTYSHLATQAEIDAMEDPFA